MTYPEQVHVLSLIMGFYASNASFTSYAQLFIKNWIYKVTRKYANGAMKML